MDYWMVVCGVWLRYRKNVSTEDQEMSEIDKAFEEYWAWYLLENLKEAE